MDQNGGMWSIETYNKHLQKQKQAKANKQIYININMVSGTYRSRQLCNDGQKKKRNKSHEKKTTQINLCQQQRLRRITKRFKTYDGIRVV